MCKAHCDNPSESPDAAKSRRRGLLPVLLKGLLGAAWLVLQLRCEQADRLMTRPADQPLTTAERIALSIHTSMCKSCRVARSQLERIDGALRAHHQVELADEPVPGTEGLSNDARERLRAAMKKNH
ncbi:MAG: hypothetical protein AAGG07_10230 [Planctomycetota bacterium]